MKHTALLHGVAELLKEASQRRLRDRQRLDAARLLASTGREAEAVAAYKVILKELKNDAGVWHELALLQIKLGRADEACASLLESIGADATRMRAHHDFGKICGGGAEVTRRYLSLLGLEGDPAADDYLRRSYLQTASNHLPEAFETLLAAVAAGLQTPDVFSGLADLCEMQGLVSQSHAYRGHAHYFKDENSHAIESYRQAMAGGPAEPLVYSRFAWSLAAVKRHDEAISVCRQGIAHHPDEEALYCRLAEMLQSDGRVEESKQVAADASARFPRSFELKRWLALSLPVVYETTEDIAVYRTRFAEGLADLGRCVATAKAAEALPGAWHNFYLAYQGGDDKALQSECGALVRQVMCANYPQWSRPVAMPAPGAHGKIRVGYVSTHLHKHTVAKLFLGWLQAHDRNRVEVYAYHLGTRIDPMTHQFQRAADHFRHLPVALERVAKAIIQDQLHILVYLDIGMDTVSVKLSSLNLAPVQCVAWGHPVTTGLPSIDYFISSELMEPDNADQHYSETLIRLPGIGVNVPPPHVEHGLRSRADFGLGAEDCVFLTPQSAFKYLPQYDDVFPRIAGRVKHARFVFLRSGSANVARILEARLLSAFARHGLDGQEHLVFLPPQDHQDYLALNGAADVFLDQPGWSGGMTTLEALGCGLPVVTWPGAFLRARHSYAFLRRMALDQMIATDLDHFVDIAARLGTDVAWRQEQRQEVAARAHLLFGDSSCVAALERFYFGVLQTR